MVTHWTGTVRLLVHPWALLLFSVVCQARVVQEVPSEEYFMNYKQVQDCDNPMVDGTCPLLGGPYRLPNMCVRRRLTITPLAISATLRAMMGITCLILPLTLEPTMWRGVGSRARRSRHPAGSL